jgi:hypothetical protein
MVDYARWIRNVGGVVAYLNVLYGSHLNSLSLTCAVTKFGNGYDPTHK